MALALVAAGCRSDASKADENLGAGDDGGAAGSSGAGSPAADGGGTSGAAGSPPTAAAGASAGGGGRAPGGESGAGGRGASAAGAAARSGSDRAGSGGVAAGSGAGAPAMPVADAGAADGGSGNETCTADTMPPQNIPLTGNLGTHDPVVIESGGRYFLFHTGRGVPTKTSDDMRAWRAGPPVFSSNPSWIANQVPGATDLWAPDISFFGDRYHLYYSASTFGSNRSCIGHATRASLTEGSWADQGPVICSNAGGARDDWNAIDPNVIVDAEGQAWMSFGSFWSGLKLIALDRDGKRQGNELISIAGRNGGAIEAPFIVRRCDYYYLFVSFDSCCRAQDSTYKIMVGRSQQVRGPYVDRAGMQLLRGGGTLILQGDARWKGPGHNAVIFDEGRAFNVYHAYGTNDGRPMLRISELAWDAEGWPSSGGP